MSEPPSKIGKIESLATSRVESEEAISTHDSSPPSETTDPGCDWCSRIRLNGMGHTLPQDEGKWLQQMFHSDCECRCRENAFPSSACGFCKHLSIRHLLCCVSFPKRFGFPEMFSDWHFRKNPQNGCQFCEYINSHGTSAPEIGLHIFKNFKDWWCALILRGTKQKIDFICLSQGSVPQLQEHVNWKQIKRWISETDVEEGNLLVDFRVIDVQRNCIVSPDYPVNYVALSYVWGNSSQKENPFQASMRNIEDLEIEGSLSRAPLPRTITDAMEVCRQLDRQYLWVDRLCIIQDDESKHGQIQRMDSIFGSSQFTIIALSGQDADDGLPGVSQPRKSHRLKILEWQGITLTDYFPNIHDFINSSYWAKRGWTFQEEFLSRKNLYFTECGVYYSSTGDNTQDSECVADNIRRRTQYFSFPDSVEAYAKRSFTDPGDLLRAFTGVLNREFGHEHHFGNNTPRSGYWRYPFCKWIHWQPVDWEYEARRPPKDISTEPVSHIQPHKSDIFPSWSWTSAQGGVRFEMRLISVALWAFPVAQESQGDSNVEWVSMNEEADRLREVTVESGLIPANEFPFEPTNDPTLQQIAISASSTPFEKVDLDEACKKLGRILSFTQIASLHLESLDDHFRNDGRCSFRIMSSTGECMGGIWLPILSHEHIFNKDGRLEEKEFDFMALSSFEFYWEADGVLNDVGLEYNQDRAVLHVMLIWKATDSNVARRLGIGHVFKDQWLKERPVLKTVILE